MDPEYEAIVLFTSTKRGVQTIRISTDRRIPPSTLNSELCTLYSVLCTLYSVLCTLYGCTLYGCTLYGCTLYNPVYEYSIYASQLYRYSSTTARTTTCTVYVLHTGTLPVQISVYSYEPTQASYRVYSVTGVYTGARGLRNRVSALNAGRRGVARFKHRKIQLVRFS